MLQTRQAFCTCLFGHLLGIEQEVAVGAHGSGPLALVRGPDGCVVVQGKGQMVVYQVLSRHLQNRQFSVES